MAWEDLQHLPGDLGRPHPSHLLLPCYSQFVHVPLHPNTMDTHTHLSSKVGPLKKVFNSSWEIVLLYSHPPLGLYLSFLEPGSCFFLESGKSFAWEDHRLQQKWPHLLLQPELGNILYPSKRFWEPWSCHLRHSCSRPDL